MTKKFMLVATVKDEALNMWEWVAYHLMIGFTNIVIYQNDFDRFDAPNAVHVGKNRRDPLFQE